MVPEGSEFADKLEITDDMTSRRQLRAASWRSCTASCPTAAPMPAMLQDLRLRLSGHIVMMVGVDADKAITGISVVSHSETSGIGTKVVGNEPNDRRHPRLDQFIGKSGAGSWSLARPTSTPSPALPCPPRASPWAPMPLWLLPEVMG